MQSTKGSDSLLLAFLFGKVLHSCSHQKLLRTGESTAEKLALLMPASNIIQLIPILVWLIGGGYQHGPFFIFCSAFLYRHIILVYGCCPCHLATRYSLLSFVFFPSSPRNLLASQKLGKASCWIINSTTGREILPTGYICLWCLWFQINATQYSIKLDCTIQKTLFIFLHHIGYCKSGMWWSYTSLSCQKPEISYCKIWNHRFLQFFPVPALIWAH